MATIAVKVFQSTDTGAPTLAGVAGDMIKVLDACLLNGYNSKNIIGITRENQVAIVNVASHGFVIDQVVQHAGFDQAEYNGDFRVQSVVDSNNYTVLVSGSPVTPATGTSPTTKTAPAGWESPYRSGSPTVIKAVYRSLASDSTKLYLRVDDSAATGQAATPTPKWAMIRGYETMTGIDTGTGLFPTGTYGNWIRKSSTADATVRAWKLFADDKIFYLFIAYHASDGSNWTGSCFGDIIPYKLGDAYHCICQATWNETTTYTWNGSTFGIVNSRSGSCNGGFFAIARDYHQIGSFVRVGMIGEALNNTNATYYGASVIGSNASGASAYWGSMPTFPNMPDMGLLMAELQCGRNSGQIRGKFPGIYQPLQYKPLANGDVFSNSDLLPGRKFMQLNLRVCDASAFIYNQTDHSSVSDTGACFMDMYGPWR